MKADELFRRMLRLGACFLIFSPWSHSAVAQPAEVSQEMREVRRSRWMNSTEQLLVAPYYSIEGECQARLLVMNRFAEPIHFEARVLSTSGRSYPLGDDPIPARGVVEIDLREVLAFARPGFERGAVSPVRLNSPHAGS